MLLEGKQPDIIVIVLDVINSVINTIVHQETQDILNPCTTTINSIYPIEFMEWDNFLPKNDLSSSVEVSTFVDKVQFMLKGASQ